jgi:diacylglycerol diphosphate phosphatase/phosphatidate phosphatase
MSYGRRNGWEDDVGRAPVERPEHNVRLLQLIKHHLRDWLWVGVMIVLELVVYLVWPPFHRFVSKTKMQEYLYPHSPETVPTWAIGIIAVLVPFLVFLFYYIRRRSIRDFHNAFLGLATAIVVTALFTDTTKNMVGMPRPDFFDRCFPDGIAVYSNDVRQRAICHPNSKSLYEDGYKSFPSGHVSWSFAGLGYLSLYLAGKLSLFDQRGYSSRVFFILAPNLATVVIGVSRVNDYQHRWVDLIGAAFIGLPVAYFCYRQFFPSIYVGSWAGYPYEYEPQGIFSHGLHGPRAIPTTTAPQNDLETGARVKSRPGLSNEMA